MTQTVLVLSPHFPPSSLAGVHRARHLAKHLPSHGWRPIVVRVDECHYSEAIDPALAALVPGEVQQVCTGALPAQLCRLGGVGDIGLRAWPYLGRAVHRLIAAERPRIVFITGSPFYPMLLAQGIRTRFNLPVVLDFQDPWVSTRARTRPRAIKARIADRLAQTLEPAAVRYAAFITSVSDIQNKEMAARYPWLDGRRMAAIPIGGDPDDYAILRGATCTDVSHTLDLGKINLTYVGTFLPRAGRVVSQLFAAVAALRRQSPILGERLRLNFVGTSNQTSGAGGLRVLPLAQAAGIADLVRETSARVPYLTALSLMANSDGLFLIGSDEPHYTASKIYPALLSGRPYLAMFHVASSAHAILSAAGGGRTIAFANDEELAGSTAEIVAALRVLASAPESMGKFRPEGIEPYMAYSVAGRFAAIFDQLSCTR